MKSIFFSIIICFLISISLVNAAGLIVNQSQGSLTKIAGQNLLYTFNIANTEAFPFYNISIESNNFITSPIITQLNSSQMATVTVGVVANQSFGPSKFRIQGYYNTNVGASNKTHVVNVDYYNGLTPCDLTITKGDKVTWKNSVSDEIQLKNVVSGSIVTTMQANANYTTNFDSPQQFKYSFLRRGFIFTNVCTITALADSGLVNNPQYDGFLNMTVNYVFNPTSIGYNLPTNNYTLDVFQSQDGVLTLSNSGNQSAVNINLSSEWITFSPNFFNLEPGQTRGVIYTVRPVITTTAQTNKSYTKNIIVSGNFNTISLPINIFVNYALMDSGNQTGNYQSLLALLKQFCKDNPQETFCKDKPDVIYVGNGTDTSFNVTYSQEQVKAIYSYIFAMGDDQRVVNNFEKEKLNNISVTIEDIRNVVMNSSSRIEALEKERQETTGNTTTTIIIFIMIAILALIIIVIFVLRRYKGQQKAARW